MDWLQQFVDRLQRIFGYKNRRAPVSAAVEPANPPATDDPELPKTSRDLLDKINAAVACAPKVVDSRPAKEIRAALVASLELVPCAACSCDIGAAELPMERAFNDPPCECCHMNWPTRIEIGSGMLNRV